MFSPLVVAGIWGATLSSALGSILGAPRILQAISIDKITPKLFGRGYGTQNEPRNALLLTFLIAEAGIMIGELDVIASVIVGGTPLGGGSGGLTATLTGVLLLRVIDNLLTQFSVGAEYRKVVTGLIIVIVVTVDVLAKKRSRK